MTVRFLVQNKDLSLKAALEPAELVLKKALEELKKLGIKKSNMQVSNYQIKPVYKEIRDHSKFYGFFVTYEVTVSV